MSLLLLFLATTKISFGQGAIVDHKVPLPPKVLPVRSGAEQLNLYLESAQSKVTAVVANPCSVVGDKHLVDTLLELGARVKLIFCPEHGFRGEAEAGASVADELDPRSGLPIVSLYGNSKKPSIATLKKYGIELIIFDLQDVGCRFYTYISTLHYVMEAAAEYGCEVIVLDRPNPNGHYVDGPVLEPSYKSFVGMHPGVPIVYGMTIGEYAQMINGEHWLANGVECQLAVVPLLNYSHDSACCRNVVLPIPPSPNLRTAQAVALYPSLCLFEGTNISVGRGTPYPFEIIGNDYKLNLREAVVPSRINLAYLLDIYRHTPAGGFFLTNNFFEKLAGTKSLRNAILAGNDEATIRESWLPGIEKFKVIRAKYLLYP